MPNAARWARSHILVAIQFLARLDEHDTSLAAGISDVRAARTLLLLYGQFATRLARMTAGDLAHDGHDTYLRIAAEPSPTETERPRRPAGFGGPHGRDWAASRMSASSATRSPVVALPRLRALPLALRVSCGPISNRASRPYKNPVIPPGK